jgi:hypothetical protein
MMSPKLETIIDHAMLIYSSLPPRQQEEWHKRQRRNWVIGELKLRHGLDEKTATNLAFQAEAAVYGDGA